MLRPRDSASTAGEHRAATRVGLAVPQRLPRTVWHRPATQPRL